MATTFNEQVLEHVKCSHAALDAANTELSKQAAAKQAAQALIPGVVEALVKHERISPADREKAATLLSDPVTALNILLKTADPNETVRPKPIGTSAAKETEKTANYNPNYCGQRTSAEKPSERKFRESVLGR
jgi:hypothetical protein